MRRRKPLCGAFGRSGVRQIRFRANWMNGSGPHGVELRGPGGRAGVPLSADIQIHSTVRMVGETVVPPFEQGVRHGPAIAGDGAGYPGLGTFRGCANRAHGICTRRSIRRFCSASSAAMARSYAPELNLLPTFRPRHALPKPHGREQVHCPGRWHTSTCCGLGRAAPYGTEPHGQGCLEWKSHCRIRGRQWWLKAITTSRATPLIGLPQGQRPPFLLPLEGARQLSHLGSRRKAERGRHLVLPRNQVAGEAHRGPDRLLARRDHRDVVHSHWVRGRRREAAAVVRAPVIAPVSGTTGIGHLS